MHKFWRSNYIVRASLVTQAVENLPIMQKTQVLSLGQEDPREEEMATYSSVLAWSIPWTEEPDRLQSMGSQRIRHNWSDWAQRHGSVQAEVYFWSAKLNTWVSIWWEREWEGWNAGLWNGAKACEARWRETACGTTCLLVFRVEFLSVSLTLSNVGKWLDIHAAMFLCTRLLTFLSYAEGLTN